MSNEFIDFLMLTFIAIVVATLGIIGEHLADKARRKIHKNKKEK